MPETKYHQIIWGPSLSGLEKTVESSRVGQQTLLAGKFGFPGGQAAESLASLYPADYFQQSAFLGSVFTKISRLKFGVLYRDQEVLLIHPEAIKRVCWELINEQNIEVLFHVNPVSVKECENDGYEINLFGREGKISVQTEKLYNFATTADHCFTDFDEPGTDLFINTFFADSLPRHIPEFNVVSRLNTDIGEYVSIKITDVPTGEVEQTFNSELDRFTMYCWDHFNCRVRMVPVYPALSLKRKEFINPNS